MGGDVPQMVNHCTAFKDNIQREIANVPVEMCARVVENWAQRIDRCKRARGGHMTDIEFLCVHSNLILYCSYLRR